jgi:hypothetical protein
VVCGNLTVFAVLGFIIQAELTHLLQQKAVDVLEANEIVVTCHYRLQLSFARDFLKRFLETIEWAHQNVVDELFTKGIIGFMGPRAVSGTSAHIVLWLFMRRTPYDYGPKGIMLDHSYLYVALSRHTKRLYPLLVDVIPEFAKENLLGSKLVKRQDLERYEAQMAPLSGCHFAEKTYNLRATRAKELTPFIRLSRHLFELNFQRCQPREMSRFMPTSWEVSRGIHPPCCFWDRQVFGLDGPEFIPDLWDTFAGAAEAAFTETTPQMLIRDRSEVKVADHFFGEGLVQLIERLLQEKSDTQLPDFTGYGSLAEKWSANGDYPEWDSLEDDTPMAVLGDTSSSMIDAISCSLGGGSQAMVEVPILAPIFTQSQRPRTLEDILESLTSFTVKYMLALEGLPLDGEDPKYFFTCGRHKAAEVAITGIDEEGLPCDHIYAYKQCTSDRPAFTIRQRAPALQDAPADDKDGSTEVFGPQGESAVELCPAQACVLLL